MRYILIFLLLFSVSAFAADIEQVIATGYGVDAESSLINAMENAVQQVIETQVTTETFAHNLHLLNENVIVSSSGYIKSYDYLLIEEGANGQVRTVIEAQVYTAFSHCGNMATKSTPC